MVVTAAGAGAGGAEAAAAVAQAVKASGAIVEVEPEEFQRILSRIESGLVVQTRGGILKKKNEYLASYRGFVFHTKSEQRLSLPSSVEMVWAKKIWVP